MVCTRIPGYAFLGFLLVATPALARVVISEVMWMGSDQSTADEWVELVCVEQGCPQTLSGWTLTSLGNDGKENTFVRFGDTTMNTEQYFVVANYPASQSRLATDPVLTTTAMTLPNTKLLLRLRNASGAIVDEVDDGVGAPFAGANPSGTGAKASMERIDLLGAGNTKEHWQTAIATIGFDPGVPIFGTPGFPRIVGSSGLSESSISSSSSSFVSVPPQSSSSASDVGSFSLAPSSSLSSVEGHSSSQTSDAGSSCIPNVSNIHIAIQSGEPRSEGKVTVNLQLLWDGKGSLRCTWNYGDSFTSTSCNPPSHTFSVPGKYEIRVEGEDVCGGKTVQTLPVEVIGTRKGGGPLPLTYARVIRVIDGDTVEVMEEGGKIEVIRLLGIDAPERSQGYLTEKWAKVAQEVLRGLLDGAAIELTFDEDLSDVYGRTLAYLAIRGHDIGAELLRQGLAEVYPKCRCARREEYLRLQEEARRKGMGMWGVEGQGDQEGKVGTVGQVGTVNKVGVEEEGEKDRKLQEAMVMVSEVYPVPLPAEGEWVELWNAGKEPFDLSWWKIDDEEDAGSTAWEFPRGFIVPPNAFLVLRSDQTHLAFNNEGDSVVLLAPDGRVVDRFMYGKLRRGHAFVRVIQRIGSTGEFRATDRFCITDHPTPFERNICQDVLGQSPALDPAARGPEGPSGPERERKSKGEEESSFLVSDPAFAQPSHELRPASKATAGKRDDAGTIKKSSKARRVVRLARRVKYRNVLPLGDSGAVAVPDPLFTELLAHMERSVQNGQVMWGKEDGTSGKQKTVEWEAMLLPLLLVIGAHALLMGMMKRG